jgi:predicted GNAT family acetyltransferase
MHYARDSTVITIRSTVVEASARGRGIATAFIAHVLDELRDAEETLVIECPEVRRFVTTHPEYAELVS